MLQRFAQGLPGVDRAKGRELIATLLRPFEREGDSTLSLWERLG